MGILVYNETLVEATETIETVQDTRSGECLGGKPSGNGALCRRRRCQGCVAVSPRGRVFGPTDAVVALDGATRRRESFAVQTKTVDVMYRHSGCYCCW